MSCRWCPCWLLKGLPKPPTWWHLSVFPTARKDLGSGGWCSPKCSETSGAQAQPMCPGAIRMEGTQLAECPSPTLYCTNRAASRHISRELFARGHFHTHKPAFVFSKVNFSAYYSQTSAIQYILCKHCVHMDTRWSHPQALGTAYSNPHTLALCNKPKHSPRTRFMFHCKYG